MLQVQTEVRMLLLQLIAEHYNGGLDSLHIKGKYKDYILNIQAATMFLFP